MDKSDTDKGCSSDESGQLHRNRSFKSKQLVRSQAIRESQSPPRTISPAALAPSDKSTNGSDKIVKTNDNIVKSYDKVVKASSAKADCGTASDKVVNINEKGVKKVSRENDGSSHVSDSSSANSLGLSEDRRRQKVEIQITPGAWDEQPTEQRQRTRRWLGHRQHSRDLLSNNPRVACVCGACGACPHCRGRRRRPVCPTKQDSGIVCSDDCPDCSDSEHTGSSVDGVPRKTHSLEADDQTFYCRCPERKEKPKSISLSRTDSDDKSEPTGQDLVNFIRDTLNKNSRDRMTLLRIERELHSLINDTGRCIVRFPVMTSYGRMLVHRCASLFQLSHHLDQANKSAVTVSKSGTSGGRIPCTSFKQWCTATFPPSPQRRTPDHISAKSILKRDTNSLDEPGAGAANAVRSKSLEQREREYERVRKKIFNSEACQDDTQWPWLTSGPVKLLTPDGGRNKLLKVQSLETGSGPPQQWERRGAVAKSHSFGGYGQPDPPRQLSKQGDLASSSWRLSPSSSGYRTLSLHSTDSVTPSPTGGASPEPSGGSQGAVVWAVTDMACVPPGAVVIHPQTGRALTNPDGSVYHFDPNNPPLLYDNSYTHEHDKAEQNNEKRRGRLEKQHSFIDSECECPPTEEFRSKCHCQCRQKNHEKVSSHLDQRSVQKPMSPCKTRYEKPDTPANHSTPIDASTNHRRAYDPPTNQKEAETKGYESQSGGSNQHSVFEPPIQYELMSTNQRPERAFEIQRPQSHDGQKYEPTNHRSNYEQTNHRPNKLTNQDSQEYGTHYYAQNYPQYRLEEVTSPPQVQAMQYVQPDPSATGVTYTKVPLPDPNIRAMPLTNMVYPSVPQAYPYQMRMEQNLQPLYQPIQPAETKQTTPPAQENTFRIDPSYPYAPVDYSQCGACAGSCVDTNLHQPARSYTAPYTPEAQQLGYPLSGMMVPQPALQPYPYQEPVQWAHVQLPAPQMAGQVPVPAVNGPKLLLHELYPLVQLPGVYPQYMYPQGSQVLPQPYQLCQPVYPVAEKHEQQRSNSASSQRGKRNSASGSGSARATPLQTPPEETKAYEEPPSRAPTTPARDVSRQNSCEIAVKIQQIKDQMAQLNTRPERSGNGGPSHPTAGRRDDWKRRNSGNGILGSYPTSGYNGRLQAGSDNSQLSTAARAIVNSIRNMQAKGPYNQDRRADYNHNQHQNNNHYRNDRRRPDDNNRGEEAADDGRDARRHVVPFQYRPPYLLRQMSPSTWWRRSPGPVHPVLNHPRRPYPDARNARR